ncbi:MAG: glycoside hydrolase family 31 protein, partial [Ruthenibacterium sp.]
MEIKLLQQEYWYGGAVYEGIRQPYHGESCCEVRLRENETPNQCMPLLLSSKGRWLWCAQGFTASFRAGTITCEDEVQLGAAPQPTLRGAYCDAMQRFFAPAAQDPDERLFTAPVYNTWIEHTFYQTQQAVLSYAEGVLANGFAPGVLMIDDGWSPYYGKWKFEKEKFPDAKAMLDALHQKGFCVMVWVCPFITPDTLEYRALAQKRLLVEEKEGTPYLARWWNGCSAVLDLTKPEASQWLRAQLEALQAIGVDGFKFDAGDSVYYPENGDVQCEAWAHFGAAYPLNEFRAAYKAGGLPLMHRLCDKHPAWGETGLAALVPDALAAGLTGQPFVCPDMIGGGEYASFLQQSSVDEMLFVRWAQAACLMPVMQFSAAPWRVLTAKALAAVKQAVALRTRLQDKINAAVQDCVHTGEPMLRAMTYMYPDEACETVMDAFMLGCDILVAPLLTQEESRSVYVPKGAWRFQESVLQSKGEWMTLCA